MESRQTSSKKKYLKKIKPVTTEKANTFAIDSTKTGK